MDVFRILGTGIRFNKTERELAASPPAKDPIIQEELDPELDFFNDGDRQKPLTFDNAAKDAQNDPKCNL